MIQNNIFVIDNTVDSFSSHEALRSNVRFEFNFRIMIPSFFQRQGFSLSICPEAIICAIIVPSVARSINMNHIVSARRTISAIESSRNQPLVPNIGVLRAIFQLDSNFLGNVVAGLATRQKLCIVLIEVFVQSDIHFTGRKDVGLGIGIGEICKGGADDGDGGKCDAHAEGKNLLFHWSQLLSFLYLGKLVYGLVVGAGTLSHASAAVSMPSFCTA